MKIYDYDGKKNISGSRISQARKKNKISQTDLAARMQVAGVNIGRDSISRIESGVKRVTLKAEKTRVFSTAYFFISKDGGRRLKDGQIHVFDVRSAPRDRKAT